MSRLKDLRKIVYKRLKKNCAPEDFCGAIAHLNGVALAAVMIAKKRGLDEELLAMAGMLHDLAAYESGSYDEHAARGAALAKRILQEEALTDEAETEAICLAIASHDDKALTGGAMEEALKDADVIHHTLADPKKAVKEKERLRYEKLLSEFGLFGEG